MSAQTCLDISGEHRPANPKLAGSGIVACRPQVGPCPGRCEDCYEHWERKAALRGDQVPPRDEEP